MRAVFGIGCGLLLLIMVAVPMLGFGLFSVRVAAPVEHVSVKQMPAPLSESQVRVAIDGQEIELAPPDHPFAAQNPSGVPRFDSSAAVMPMRRTSSRISFLGVIAMAGLAFLALLGVLVLLLARGRRRQSTSGKTSREEARILQELHRGLQQLTERVEALETLLMDLQKRAP